MNLFFFFSTYLDIVKYFLKKRLFASFIYFNNKIQYCIFYNKINYIFFDDIKFINLIVNDYYSLKFFFCYLQSKDKYSFNIKSNIYDLKFYYINIYLIILLLINLFFLKNLVLIIPQIVKIYNGVLRLLREVRFLNRRMERVKLYRKKNRIKITRKMKKERKLYHLNNFFAAIIEKHKKNKNVQN